MVVTSLFSSTCAFNKLHLSSELVNENVSFKTIAMKMYVCKSCRKHKIHEIDDVDRKVLFIRTFFYEFPSCSLIVAMLSNLQFFNKHLAIRKANDLYFLPSFTLSFS